VYVTDAFAMSSENIERIEQSIQNQEKQDGTRRLQLTVMPPHAVTLTFDLLT